MDVILVFVPFILFLITYYIFWRKRWMTVLKRHGITGPKPHLIYGNLRELKKEKSVKCVEKWLKEYGPIFGYYTGGRPTVVITDPELLKQIFIRDFKLFNTKNLPKEFATQSNELATSSLLRKKGKDWKELRTLLRPAFSVAKMKGYFPEIRESIGAFIENLEMERKNNATDFNIYPLYQGMSLDVISKSAFGVHSNVQKNSNDLFLKSIGGTIKLISGRTLDTALVLFPEFTPILYTVRKLAFKIDNFLFTTSTKYLVDFATHVISERRKNKEKKRNDLLQSMIDGKINPKLADEVDNDTLSVNPSFENSEIERDEKNGRELTNCEIIANSILFLEAGYETTSTSLAYVTHILVNHSDLQEKVRQEVLELVKRDGKLDYNSVSQMQFMDAVINETLRIYPPLTFFVTRVAETDYHYQNITIPKGMPVMSPTYHIHHDPNFWNEPEKFDPYRFYGENKINANNLLWQPFGIGPRNCIGMRFALLEMKLAIAEILLNYQLEPGPRTEIGELSVTNRSFLRVPNHVYVRIVPHHERKNT